MRCLTTSSSGMGWSSTGPAFRGIARTSRSRTARIAEIGPRPGSCRRRLIGTPRGSSSPPASSTSTRTTTLQPFWDRLCTSSIWHGVTTVLTGNCGLTLAPAAPRAPRDDAGDLLLRRGSPRGRAERRACPGPWQSFDEFLDSHRHRTRRQHDAPGWAQPAASERHGRGGLGPGGHSYEIAAMQRLLRAALEEGAWGWSTTVSPTHAGPAGATGADAAGRRR